MSERIVAVIPIRSLRNGKTRLAAVLSATARATLLRTTAEGVVAAALAAPAVASVLVVSPDPTVLAWAGGVAGVVPLPQGDDRPGLNGAIDAGRAWALEHGADAILSLFGDLPLLSHRDLGAMAACLAPVVLGSDRHGAGTNALLLRLRGRGAAFQFAFGEESLSKHAAEARRLGLVAVIHESPGIGFDLDTPADWADYRLHQAEGLVAAGARAPAIRGAGAE